MSDSPAPVSRRIPIRLEVRLQHQALVEVEIIERARAKRVVAGIAGRHRGGDLPEFNRQTLYAQRRPATRPAAGEIDANTGLEVEIRADRAVIEELMIAILHAAAIGGIGACMPGRGASVPRVISLHSMS